MTQLNTGPVKRRRKRSHGEGTIAETKTGWQCEYRRKYKTFSKTDCQTKRDAVEKFALWRKELDEQARIIRDRITTMSELFDRFLRELRINGRTVYNPTRVLEKHLRPALGHIVAAKLTLDDVEAYIDKRLGEKTYTRRGKTYTRRRPVRPATVNRELSYIVTALRLNRPNVIDLKIRKLDESDGIRRGLVSREAYEQLLAELPSYQRPVWTIAWHAGVRQGELLKVERAWVDLESMVIAVPGRDDDRARVTKNADVHYIPLYNPAMLAMARWAYETGDPRCPYLFQRNGKPIPAQTLKTAVRRARERAGLPDLLFHDTRRTAVTTMIDADIDPEHAMAVSGHKDPEVFRRYNIISEARMRKAVREAGARLAEWHRKSVANYGAITERASDGLPSELADNAKPN